ncbi:hypothetical protein TWF730_009235 [Orbilia blumenaviensis]|uniref:Uncharacterized protein n=1 Tax=Orbilia blumenaviensis TaxID=1796055 RepID=A0AAV9V1P6_9PEZI
MPEYRLKISSRYLREDILAPQLRKWFGNGKTTWEIVDDEFLIIQLLDPNAQFTKAQLDFIERNCYE